jgi:hypothetical protein
MLRIRWELQLAPTAIVNLGRVGRRFQVCEEEFDGVVNRCYRLSILW